MNKYRPGSEAPLTPPKAPTRSVVHAPPKPTRPPPRPVSKDASSSEVLENPWASMTGSSSSSSAKAKLPSRESANKLWPFASAGGDPVPTAATGSRDVPAETGTINRLKEWGGVVLSMCRAMCSFTSEMEKNTSALSRIPLGDYTTAFSAASEFLDKQEATYFKHLKTVKDVLARGDPLLTHYGPDLKPREVIVISDSTVMAKNCNKDDSTSGQRFQEEFLKRPEDWKHSLTGLTVTAQPGAKQADFKEMIMKLMLKIREDGDGPDIFGDKIFRKHLLVIISLNDVTKGKTYVPEGKTLIVKEICQMLNVLPYGTVTVLMAGSEGCWNFEAGSWDHLAKTYVDAYKNWCEHPIIEPDFFYRRMAMNKTRSKIESSKRYTEWGKEYDYNYHIDYHFLDCIDTYDRLTDLVVQACQITQTLGNLLTVAYRSELLSSMQSGSHYIGNDSPNLKEAEVMKKLNLKGSIGTDVGAFASVAEVKEEPKDATSSTAMPSLTEIARRAGMTTRAPEVGDTFYGMPKCIGPDSKIMPQCKIYTEGASDSLLPIGILPYGSVFGPATEVKALPNANQSYSIAVRVPNVYRLPGLTSDTCWVVVSEGDLTLALIKGMKNQKSGRDAEDDAEGNLVPSPTNLSSPMDESTEQPDDTATQVGDNEVQEDEPMEEIEYDEMMSIAPSVTASVAPSEIPSMVGSALRDFQPLARCFKEAAAEVEDVDMGPATEAKATVAAMDDEGRAPDIATAVEQYKQRLNAEAPPFVPPKAAAEPAVQTIGVDIRVPEFTAEEIARGYNHATLLLIDPNQPQHRRRSSVQMNAIIKRFTRLRKLKVTWQEMHRLMDEKNLSEALPSAGQPVAKAYVGSKDIRGLPTTIPKPPPPGVEPVNTVANWRKLNQSMSLPKSAPPTSPPKRKAVEVETGKEVSSAQAGASPEKKASTSSSSKGPAKEMAPPMDLVLKDLTADEKIAACCSVLDLNPDLFCYSYDDRLINPLCEIATEFRKANFLHELYCEMKSGKRQQKPTADTYTVYVDISKAMKRLQAIKDDLEKKFDSMKNKDKATRFKGDAEALEVLLANSRKCLHFLENARADMKILKPGADREHSKKADEKPLVDINEIIPAAKASSGQPGAGSGSSGVEAKRRPKSKIPEEHKHLRETRPTQPAPPPPPKMAEQSSGSWSIRRVPPEEVQHLQPFSISGSLSSASSDLQAQRARVNRDPFPGEWHLEARGDSVPTKVIDKFLSFYNVRSEKDRDGNLISGFNVYSDRQLNDSLHEATRKRYEKNLIDQAKWTQKEMLDALAVKFPPVERTAWTPIEPVVGSYTWASHTVSWLMRHSRDLPPLTITTSSRMLWKEFLFDILPRWYRNKRRPEDWYFEPHWPEATAIALECLIFSGESEDDLHPRHHRHNRRRQPRAPAIKTRFLILWDKVAERKLVQYDLGSPGWFRCIEDNDLMPLEIKCIQGRSRPTPDQLLGTIWDGDIEGVPVPADHMYLYHGTSLEAVKSILLSGELKPGGHQGVDHRSNIYFSAVDWNWYNHDFRPAIYPLTEFRREPYMPGCVYEAQVWVNNSLLQENQPAPLQQDSLAVLSTRNTPIPLAFVESIINMDGWVLYRRPLVKLDAQKPEVEHIGALTVSEARRAPVCNNCSLRFTSGQVYCWRCWNCLPDWQGKAQKEENIYYADASASSSHARGNPVLTPNADRETFWGQTSSLVSGVFRGVTLNLKRLDRPTGPFRIEDTQSTTVSASTSFGRYIKKQWERTVHPNGVKIQERENQGEPREMCMQRYDETDDNAWRQRCLDSPIYFHQLEETIRGQWPEMLIDSNGQPMAFDLDYVDALVGWARERIKHPPNHPLPLNVRKKICTGRVAVKSDQPAGGSVPLRDHPDFRRLQGHSEAIRRENEASAAAASASASGDVAARPDDEWRDDDSRNYRRGWNRWYNQFTDFAEWHVAGDSSDDWSWDYYDRGWREYPPWGRRTPRDRWSA